MKKILSLVIALFVLLSGVALAEDMTGEWYADLFGMPMTLTLNADGTYAVELMGDVDGGVWVMEGEALIMDKGTEEERPLAYDAAANTMIMEIEGVEIVFSRDAAASFVPAEPKADAALEEFAGSWEAANVYFMEMLLPAEFAGMSMTMKIENCTIDVTMDLMGDVENFVLDGVYADGAMTITEPATYNEEGMELTREVVYSINVLQDGTLSFEMDILGMPLIFYLNPAVAEEAAA